ncbi:unnamed protein product, partial [Aphanomyces euteiches]
TAARIAVIACKVFMWYEGKCYLESTVGEKIASPGRTAGFVPRETYVPITQPPTAVPPHNLQLLSLPRASPPHKLHCRPHHTNFNR